MMRKVAAILLFALALVSSQSGMAQKYHYARVGAATNASVIPRPGFALMGGGDDLDDAFRWLCDHAAGGDLLVLRARVDDEYNPYIQKLCHLNSVATLAIPSRQAAEDPFVARTIRRATVLFISGGDQSNYINFWMHTPVQAALNDALARGVPIGGTSAGLAVLGEWAYSAQGDKPDDPNLDGKTAMADPFGARITLVRGFLRIPALTGIVTDTHFATRDRMGRLLTFLARVHTPQSVSNVRGIGVEQRAAVLLDPNGDARVVGYGAAYFVDAANAHGTAAHGKALSFGPYDVQKVAAGRSFNVKRWAGDATRYTLTVEHGNIRSTQAGGAVY